MIPNDNYLCDILSDMTGFVESRLTRYHELQCFGGPIFIEKVWKVDRFVSLLLLRQQ